MKVRLHIGRVVLDGLAWSGAERRAFERSFGPALQRALQAQARTAAAPPPGRRAATESLSVGPVDAADPQRAASALALQLAAHALSTPGAAKGEL